MEKLRNTPPIYTCVEDICVAVNCGIEHEDNAQQIIEGILNYLQECDVIKEYNADRLDFVFGNDEVY